MIWIARSLISGRVACWSTSNLASTALWCKIMAAMKAASNGFGPGTQRLHVVAISMLDAHYACQLGKPCLDILLIGGVAPMR
jgi:hypothetical protein